ncbi:hypothetical protein MWG58_31650 [Streptomyces sp. WAC00276]|uniref:hypothetical protein n=1 Tax=Streptomyces sp. WAC00276 TaxID=2933778 RepID=UPI001FFE496C|nr:hypothetical protein [Streptomyces sp. WAC00276]MCK2145382.1 hypothetical protein [Streptomyces sp. WAC00276]
MGRAYLASKTQRASGGWWFRRGEDSGFVSKEKQKDACKRARLFLLEVLIAMAISSVLLLGRHAFCLRYSVQSLTSTCKLALEDEIWLRVFTVAKHLQRAGYCHGICTGEGLEIVGQGD